MASASRLARTTPCTAAAMAPMTAYRTPRRASDSATSAISSADWPGALARIRRYRVSRRGLAGNTGMRKLRHQLAMRQKRGQPLLCGHPLDVLLEAAASIVGQSRFHGVM